MEFFLSEKHRRLISNMLIPAWIVGVFIPIGYLMGFHLGSLPASFSGKSQGLFSRASTAKTWTAFHLLSGDCKCSERVANYLELRGPSTQMNESVIVVGENQKLVEGLRQHGFAVETTRPELLEKEAGVEGLPLFVLFNSDGVAVYSGGYSKVQRPSEPAQFSDLAILEAFKMGRAPASVLPVFGCANSNELRKRIDPLGLKYRKE